MIRVIVIAWIMMKIMSWKLWLAHHNFPQVPLVAMSASLQLVLFVLFFVFAVSVFIVPRNPYLLGALITTEVISMLGDQLRWQPWPYQFVFICLAVIINKENPQRAINSAIFIFASTYFFSGLQKFNGSFLYFIWMKLILIKFFSLSPDVSQYLIVRYAGLLIPLIEMACGILLVLPKTYKITAWLPISVHIFILLLLSPFGLSFDYIVFPWNIAMIIILWLFYVRNQTVFSFRFLFYKANWSIAFVWFLLPLAGLFGYWAPFFSSKLYSGTHTSMSIFFDSSVTMPAELKPYVAYSKRGYYNRYMYISTFQWCQEELNIPIPPEKRIYQSIEQSFRKRYGYLQPVFYYY